MDVTKGRSDLVRLRDFVAPMLATGLHGGCQLENPNADVGGSSPLEDRAPTTADDVSNGTDDIPFLH